MLMGRAVKVDIEDVVGGEQDGSYSDVSDSDDDEDDDPFFPTIGLTSSDKKRICRRWKVLVQLPKLYQEYYDKDILLQIARRVGLPVKVDEVTLRYGHTLDSCSSNQVYAEEVAHGNRSKPTMAGVETPPIVVSGSRFAILSEPQAQEVRMELTA
ncbi:hypothetical protein Tsubulata_034474 [Turnera subulata]|uniref:Uncharacterized protein n=1 Tax=Turnera subulata TaxID=218843 RepID=A0A9Q0GHU7_9ROSI|nr:hypothetical protein Tsubulata_034474 [Turnera subulata]